MGIVEPLRGDTEIMFTLPTVAGRDTERDNFPRCDPLLRSSGQCQVFVPSSSRAASGSESSNEARLKR